MSRNTDRLAPHTFNATRRRLLRGAALGAATLAAPGWRGRNRARSSASATGRSRRACRSMPRSRRATSRKPA